jgi:hypothetical protein
MRIVLLISILSLGLYSCEKKQNTQTDKIPETTVRNGGEEVVFSDEKSIDFFHVAKVEQKNIVADFTAPGKIVATVVASHSGASQPIVLFDNPELSGNYTQLIQHQINIKRIQQVNIQQKTVEVARYKDLLEHGAATAQDLLNAQTGLSTEQSNLSNEKAAILEHEAILEAAGFHPEVLRNAAVGSVYLTCDIPENQFSNMQEGSSCQIQFTAFQDKTFVGIIDDVAEVVDNATRMVKLRIRMKNPNSEMKAGMFSMISFGLREGNHMTIDKYSLVTIQGKSYVFKKSGPMSFQRVEVQIGHQIGDRVIVLSGIQAGDEIATSGVIQLKGLSFGY